MIIAGKKGANPSAGVWHSELKHIDFALPANQSQIETKTCRFRTVA